MIRGTLLTTIALSTIAPAAFSAAVVHNGTLIGQHAAGAGRVISQFDIARLHVATRADLIASRISLGNARIGGGLTLTGEHAKIAGSEVTLPETLASISEADANVSAVPAASVSQDATAPAPAAVALDGTGSASAFGAVPEPSSVMLLALGALPLLRRRRR